MQRSCTLSADEIRIAVDDETMGTQKCTRRDGQKRRQPLIFIKTSKISKLDPSYSAIVIFLDVVDQRHGLGYVLPLVGTTSGIPDSSIKDVHERHVILHTIRRIY